MAGKKKAKARKLPNEEDVAATVPIRIPRYLRDEILKEARGSYGGAYDRMPYRSSRAPARVLLEKLDPEVAKKYPNVPRHYR